ncbi:MAG: polyhydroxyalkanoic acid system family protein [Polyangiales bacterium]
MKHVVKHSLSHDLARKACEKALESYKERFAKYNPQAKWINDDVCDVQFTAKGFTVKGQIVIAPKEISFDLTEVPFLLRPFKSQAIELVEDQIRHWSAKAERGELV